ncbi:hypothetical protein K435DRAFT_848720 [Dendrothele bispora CBS 962.96]|uniref:Uncharacterized protein n=1 Tax=Dendrothele bispora (strain CBS 962.96) TaxID=1314807 RepID=A0A4S8MTV6_DENBC|nr:hypothetical protein K435DRAFT_848720 [Dendrothele bispora CBS 962.96]
MPPKTSIHTPHTPRRRKVPKSPSKTTQGIRTRLPDRLKDAKSIKETLKSELKLSFEPDDWQAHFVHRILQRYDGMCVAATGLGLEALAINEDTEKSSKLWEQLRMTAQIIYLSGDGPF